MYSSFIIIVFAFLFFIGFRNSFKTPEQAITDINLRDHQSLALHIHPTLEIEIFGEKQSIPAGIGITENGMRVIHTHDERGILHVESPFPYTFQLKDFFTIWGKKLTDECIFEYCQDAENELKFYKNGIESELGTEMELYDKDLVRIVYRKKGQI